MKDHWFFWLWLLFPILTVFCDVFSTKGTPQNKVVVKKALLEGYLAISTHDIYFKRILWEINSLAKRKIALEKGKKKKKTIEDKQKV